jgi:hypothetical protein
MASQLRVYTIKPGKLEEWISLFERTTLPMRRDAGFEVQAWAEAGGDRFYWLLSRPGTQEQFAEADQAYNAAPEHEAVLAEARPLVAGVETFFVEMLD